MKENDENEPFDEDCPIGSCLNAASMRQAHKELIENNDAMAYWTGWYTGKKALDGAHRELQELIRNVPITEGKKDIQQLERMWKIPCKEK